MARHGGSGGPVGDGDRLPRLPGMPNASLLGRSAAQTRRKGTAPEARAPDPLAGRHGQHVAGHPEQPKLHVRLLLSPACGRPHETPECQGTAARPEGAARSPPTAPLISSPRGDPDACARDLPNDEAVARAVIGRLEPPSVEAVRLAFEQSVADARSERRHHEIERARLAQHVADLDGKLEALDRDCVNVIKSLGQRLEQAKRELNALDAVDDASRDRAVQADLRMLAEAADVAANVWRIWDAPTTQDRDRKELLRILVRGIIVEERTAERLRLRIQWIDRVEDEFVDVWTQRGVDRLMNELFADGVSSEAIATRLNSMGLKTRRGNVFTAKRVRQAVWA